MKKINFAPTLLYLSVTAAVLYPSPSSLAAAPAPTATSTAIGVQSSAPAPTLASPPRVLEGVSEPGEFKAIDKPNDNGKAIMLTFSKMSFDTPKLQYVPLMAEAKEGPYYPQDSILASASLKSDFPASFGFAKETENDHAIEITAFKVPKADDPAKTDSKPLIPGKEYFFKINITGQDGATFTGTTVASVTPEGNLFNHAKLNNFIVMLFLACGILYFIQHARKNPNLFIRRIAGLEAIDEALGRATEMGKPAYFIHGGVTDMSFPYTIAAVSVLGQVAQKAAEYDTVLKVANNDPLVMQVCQETMKESYIRAGRPDAFKKDNVFFASADQWSYTATVSGLMMREKPAANLFIGYFYGESLLLAETGNLTGAIQIAATDALTQIPFFITSCDYTLMGEELYAASAYLSREPKMLGSLKGQDLAKVAIVIIVIAGTLLATLGLDQFAKFFWPLG